MKKPETTKILFYIFMLLPLIVTLMALSFLPERIPAHYGLSGQVDRWGSKYETLVLPVMAVIFGFFMLGMARLSAKMDENGRRNENIVIISGTAALMVFNVMQAYFLYGDFNKAENLNRLPFDAYQAVFGISGIALMVMGLIMPKLRRNSIIGLRTPWSMKNEKTWEKSQKFGGVSLMAAGIAMIAASSLTKGAALLLWSLGIVIVLTAADVYYTYRVAAKYAVHREKTEDDEKDSGSD